MTDDHRDSALAAAVARAFAADGALAEVDAGYRPRDAQQRMAQAVAEAIDADEVLVAEAGTGVGKTFAYLVPALLSGKRVMVSTATKSLQDQLFLRDLPRLAGALKVPVTIALLKGRASYLCTHRLAQARDDAQLSDRLSLRTLAKIEAWAQGTRTGDLAELDGLDERSPAIPLVTSTRENCLGSDCPQYRGCHVMKARRDAMAADVVVVNHHLFFADLALRDTGLAELLPSVEVAVFDEAHQLPEAGVAFLGTVLGSSQAIDLARDLLAAGLSQARGLQPWNDLAAAIDRAARDLRIASAGTLRDVRATIKLRWEERAGRPGFESALAALGQVARDASLALDAVAEIGPDFDRLAERARVLSQRASGFALEAAPGRVRWIDLGAQSVRLVESPLDVREAMRTQIEAAPRAWVFTSATLGAEPTLAWFTAQAGLDDARTLRVDSPFDYPSHARLYVPQRFPKPNEPGHPSAVARLGAACARAAGGRSFVLTTTLRSLSQVAEALRDDFAAAGDGIEVLVQGSAPKRALLQRFVSASRAVLVGSQSFWEGIDVPGDALQCVVIDKLPFPPPNDPLVEARVKRIESEGRSAFGEYFVAEAAISLKQGAGRLIRSETDRGLLVICDPRLAASSYGRQLIAALPPMTRVPDEAGALDWLAEIAATPA
ncbi:ATP-dependent DNA helicase [Caldimonas sp. KR1-144]|uniref:ATP-dependent DNA helicase n=1 Tax=Caldimonas sp. KR1-144 TaxID=3400911 RepID=UPI003C0CB2D6